MRISVHWEIKEMTYTELSTMKTTGFNTNHVIDDVVNNARFSYTKKAFKTAEVTEYEMQKIREAAQNEGLSSLELFAITEVFSGGFENIASDDCVSAEGY
jgi:hypothetical protein